MKNFFDTKLKFYSQTQEQLLGKIKNLKLIQIGIIFMSLFFLGLFILTSGYFILERTVLKNWQMLLWMSTLLLIALSIIIGIVNLSGKKSYLYKNEILDWVHHRQFSFEDFSEEMELLRSDEIEHELKKMIYNLAAEKLTLTSQNTRILYLQIASFIGIISCLLIQ